MDNSTDTFDESIDISNLVYSNAPVIDPSKTYGVLPNSQDKENQMIVQLSNDANETCAIKLNYDNVLNQLDSTIDHENIQSKYDDMNISFINNSKNPIDKRSTIDRSSLNELANDLKNPHHNLKKTKLNDCSDYSIKKKMKSTNDHSNENSNQTEVTVQNEVEKSKSNDNSTKSTNKFPFQSVNRSEAHRLSTSPTKLGKKCGVTILSNYYEIGNAIYSKDSKGRLIKTWHNYPAEYYDQLLNDVPPVIQKKRPVNILNNEDNLLSSKSNLNLMKSKSTGDLKKQKNSILSHQHSKVNRQIKKSENISKSINNFSKTSLITTSPDKRETQIRKILDDEASNLDNRTKSRISVKMMMLMNKIVQDVIDEKMNKLISEIDKMKQQPIFKQNSNEINDGHKVVHSSTNSTKTSLSLQNNSSNNVPKKLTTKPTKDEAIYDKNKSSNGSNV